MAQEVRVIYPVAGGSRRQGVEARVASQSGSGLEMASKAAKTRAITELLEGAVTAYRLVSYEPGGV